MADDHWVRNRSQPVANPRAFVARRCLVLVARKEEIEPGFAIRLGHKFKRTRKIVIIRVDVSADFTGRPGKAFVEGVSLSAIGLAAPVSEPMLIAADDVDCPITRAAIDDDVVEIWITLVQDRA